MQNSRRQLDYKLGTLLIQFGIAAPHSVEQAIRLSSIMSLPLGKTLALTNSIPEELVRGVIEVQSMLREKTIDFATAAKAVRIAKIRNLPVGEALRNLGVREIVSRGSRLGELLLSARRINKKQLSFGLTVSSSSGLPLGQVLVLLNRISESLLRLALALQTEIRSRAITLKQAVSRLARDTLKDETSSKISVVESDRLKLGELLVRAGLLEAEVIASAVDESLHRKVLLGQVLIEQEQLSMEELRVCLGVQSLLWNREISIVNAIQALSNLRSENFPEMQRRLQSGDMPRMTFHEFLRSSGYMTRELESKILDRVEEQPRLMAIVCDYARRVGGNGKEESLAWAVGKAVSNTAVLRCVLMETNPEDALLINSALVLYCLVEDGRMPLCQALVNFSIKRCGMEQPAALCA